MMTDIQQTHSDYLDFWKAVRLTGFMVSVVVCVHLTFFSFIYENTIDDWNVTFPFHGALNHHSVQ